MKKILMLFAALILFGSMTVKAEEAYVAGSETEIFGSPAWNPSLMANQMVWDEGLAKYCKVYTVDKAYKSVGVKVVYNGQWYGANEGGEEVKFSLSGPGDFVVYFSKATYHVTVGGPIVGEEQLGPDEGFEDIGTSDRPLKVMTDGTLNILRGEKRYDATGRMVK